MVILSRPSPVNSGRCFDTGSSRRSHPRARQSMAALAKASISEGLFATSCGDRGEQGHECEGGHGAHEGTGIRGTLGGAITGLYAPSAEGIRGLLCRAQQTSSHNADAAPERSGNDRCLDCGIFLLCVSPLASTPTRRIKPQLSRGEPRALDGCAAGHGSHLYHSSSWLHYLYSNKYNVVTLHFSAWLTCGTLNTFGHSHTYCVSYFYCFNTPILRPPC